MTNVSSLRPPGTAALPLASLRLLVPPVRLLSAFAWQVVQQRRVSLYGRLADLVGLVTETVPDLLGPSQRAELLLGLRARLILELCKADGPRNLHSIRSNLEKIHACTAELSSAHQGNGVKTLESSYTNFSKLVLKLVSVPSEKEHFLKEVFPVRYGSAYDQTLGRLVSEFVSRLEQLLPTPTLTQTATWLTDGGTAAEEFSRSLFDPSALKTLLLHHRQMGTISTEAPCVEDDTIMATLALPPEATGAATTAAAAASPEEVEDSGNSDGDVCGGEEDSQDGSVGRSDEWLPAKPPGAKRSNPQQRLVAAPTLRLVKVHLRKIGPPQIPAATGPHIPPTATDPGTQQPAPARRTRGRKAADGKSRTGQRTENDDDDAAEQSAASAKTTTTTRKRRKGAQEGEERAEGGERPDVDAAAAAPASPKGEDRRFLSARPANACYAEEETRCPRCDKSFQLPNQLKNHMKLHALPYRCLPCEKGFGSKSGFYQHQRLHKKGRAFPCAHCARSFLCRYSLRQHERTHTDGPTYLCTECGKRFSKVSIVRHMRMHAGQRDYLCTACGKTFLSSGELLLHSRTHTRDAPYTCTRCGKAFTTKSHLTVHGRSHTGERPYPCTLCPKRFLTVSCLKRHMLSHDGVKPFGCPKCPKEFSQKGNLKKHMTTHQPLP
ncbi:unnamed protein product [Merluccius merluccius]